MDFFLTTGSILVVTDDGQLFFALLSYLLLLSRKSRSVGSFDFTDCSFGLEFLLLLSTTVLFLQLLDVTDHLLSFPLGHFSFTDPFLFSLGDLLDNDSCTFPLCFDASLLLTFGFLETLQSLDLHHDVKALLFFDIVSLEFLRLFKLLVSDSNDLGIENHLVHVLNVVMLLIEFLLGLGKNSAILLLSGDLELIGR